VDLEKVSNTGSKLQEKVEPEEKKNANVIATVKEEPECLMCSS